MCWRDINMMMLEMFWKQLGPLLSRMGWPMAGSCCLVRMAGTCEDESLSRVVLVGETSDSDSKTVHLLVGLLQHEQHKLFKITSVIFFKINY